MAMPMADSQDSISNSSHGTQKQRKRRDKPLLSSSWKASLRFFSTCKDNSDASPIKKLGTNTKKNNKIKKMMNLDAISPCNSVCPPDNDIDIDNTSRAISASSSFNSVTTASSTFSSSLSSRSFSSLGGSFRGLQMRKLSAACSSEYNAVNWVPSPSLRASLSPCNACGEIFTKPESLEMHQATQHAVSELGPEDTSRKIVEIIFQSSWLKKIKQSPSPVCKIERILKIHNTKTTIAKFEEYRESIKLKSIDQVMKKKQNPRCSADGNELLRFYGTASACDLGLDNATHLCKSVSKCNACSIIKDGFKLDKQGKICTVGTSGRAHAMVPDPLVGEGEKRAMLVCRVVAGRIKGRNDDDEEEEGFDSATSSEGFLDELSVFNPRAILPCFVVIYCGY